MIQMQDICFSYEDAVVLSHFHMEIKEGETVILKGPNGCGKSTVLKLMNGLIFPELGTYLFDGQAVTKKTMEDAAFSRDFHRKIGYLFQNADSQLFHNSVEDEIAFALVQMGKEEAEIDKRVEDMLTLLDIAKLRQRAPYHLSSGEKKKVALASILVANPRVIILDEPISGLDRSAQEWMLDFFAQMKQAGKTIVIATHNEELARRLGDREIIFES
ncbi:MAG: energy-coupling factor ABC transporter ATP-binding protein [Lachnospiraceae bacterium]|nr:energy-coupling factor ABC transporter ATP-binding protein [Lachnospiraceae bacterium]